MLIFDANKNKKLQMSVESSGIENDKLRFIFTIDTGSVQYGFPCIFTEGKVEVDIPPLNDIIKEVKSGTYRARLDVMGDNKYYLNPFNESIEIKTSPVIKSISVKDDGMNEDIKLAISNLIESNDEESKKSEEKDVKPTNEKKSGIASFLSKK